MGAGFDIVSGGELLRALKAGGSPQKIVFSGVGKTAEEIDQGLQRDILQFNVESEAELQILEERARALKKVARLSFRVNPDVDPKTHPYISTGLSQHKFGIPIEDAPPLYRKAARSPYLAITGIGYHIGSQITQVEPFVDALTRLKHMVLSLRSNGINIRHLDLGGGLGITYNDEVPPHPDDYGKIVLDLVKDLDCTVLLEPGRVLVGNAGILVTRVLLTKQNRSKNFVVIDAAMNDLVRPSLYGSYHGIQPETLTRRGRWIADVVGPICESGDFLARAREMPVVKRGDLLAIMSAGAYGFVLASNYNSRPRIPEVMVKDKTIKVIRKRESFRDLIRGESV
jgi:diaminopimelate decarboxylase